MNPTSERPGRPRSIQLDVLRGIAILLVLGRHPVSSATGAGVFYPLSGIWFRFGWTGVDLFFVLSGFLIGGLLFEELHARGGLDLGRFLVRRSFKIWPSYYIYLAFLTAILLVGLDGTPGLPPGVVLRDLLPSFLNVQNYFVAMPRPHLWSLAVEEHFYLALPLTLWVLSRRRRGGPTPGADPVRGFPILVLTLMIACTAARCVKVTTQPYTDLTHQFPTHLRIDSLAFGVLLSYVRRFRPDVWLRLEANRGALLLAGLALISPMTVLVAYRSRFVASAGYVLLYVGYGAILVAFLASSKDGGLLGRLLHGRLARAVAFVGFYSYPIYLWHMDLGRAPAAWIFDSESLKSSPNASTWAVATATYVALAIFAGVAMGRLVERPALLLRERLFPGRTAPILDEPVPDRATAEPVPSITLA